MLRLMLLASLPLAAHAADLPRADPASAGMDGPRLHAIGRMLQADRNGAGGASMRVDPAQDLLAVFMIQAPKQGRHHACAIGDMVYAAVSP